MLYAPQKVHQLPSSIFNGKGAAQRAKQWQLSHHAEVHHAARAIYAKAEHAPQNQTNHLSGGGGMCFWVSHPRVLFLG